MFTRKVIEKMWERNIQRFYWVVTKCPRIEGMKWPWVRNIQNTQMIRASSQTNLLQSQSSLISFRVSGTNFYSVTWLTRLFWGKWEGAELKLGLHFFVGLVPAFHFILTLLNVHFRVSLCRFVQIYRVLRQMTSFMIWGFRSYLTTVILFQWIILLLCRTHFEG